MGLFNKKPRLTIIEFCENFFDKYFFPQPICGSNPWNDFSDQVREQIISLYPDLKRVTQSKFAEELLALRLEVFSIVWMIHMKEKLALKQSACTCHYLEKHRREKYWALMEPYNRATARSVIGGSDPDTAKGRYHITFINGMRKDLFDKWITDGHDPRGAAQVANRIGCKEAWSSLKVHIYLSFAFTDQIACDISDEAREAFLSIIQGFHDGVWSELSQVKITS